MMSRLLLLLCDGREERREGQRLAEEQPPHLLLLPHLPLALEERRWRAAALHLHSTAKTGRLIRRALAPSTLPPSTTNNPMATGEAEWERHLAGV